MNSPLITELERHALLGTPQSSDLANPIKIDNEDADIISRLPLYLSSRHDLHTAIDLLKSELGINSGMSEKQAIAKFGPPSSSQIQRFDDLVVIYDEWANEEGTISVQFQNDEAKCITFIPND